MLRLAQLCKGYQDGSEYHSVLQGAELNLERGAQLALMGESGSGKSTLLNLIAGLDSCDAGEIWLGDTPIHAISERQRALFRRNNIGLVFQQFNLLPTITIADNIRFCRQLKGLPESPDLWRQIISALDLMSLLDRFPEEVSGGQQQRAAIARAKGDSCMLSPVIKALWGHYKRHPFQIMLVWLGLTLGIALLVGVMGVNQQARESYRQGELLFSNPYPYRIRTAQLGLKVPQGFYIQLRRAGLKSCAPLDATLRADMLDLMKPPYPIIAGEQLASYGKKIGPVEIVPDELTGGPRLVADIARLRDIQPSSGFTSIVCGLPA